MMMKVDYRCALLSGLLLTAFTSANAVDVVITDIDHPSGTTCQNMSSIELTQQSVSIEFPGECIGTGTVAGQSVAVNQTMSATGGSTGTKDLSTGATVTLPFEATAATITAQGTKGSATINAGTTTVTYYANQIEVATTDTFYYRLNDATALNTNTAKVDVSIAAGSTGGSCVPSATVICKGVLSLVAGTFSPAQGLGDTLDHNHWKLMPNTTHVYQFTYQSGNWRFVLDQVAAYKKIRLSTTSVDMSVDTTGCYTDSNNSMYASSDEGTINNVYCELHAGITYFLNVQTIKTSEDAYYLYIANF